MNQETNADYLPNDDSLLAMVGLSGPIIPQMPLDHEEKRSPKWPLFLRNFLAKNKNCIGCGRKAQTGHHCKPFHLFPDLELEEENIAAVCIPCHFVICHAGDWRLYVEEVKTLLEGHLLVVQKAEK